MVWYNPKTWVMDPKWPILSGLPTIQFRMLFLCLLDLLTVLWFYHMTEINLHAAVEAMRTAKSFSQIEPSIIVGSWLAFLAGAHGFAYAGYRTKRNTSWDGNIEEDRGSPDATNSMTQERPIVNPASVRAANQARMQGSGTTADAPALAVPAVVVPVVEPPLIVDRSHPDTADKKLSD